MQRNNSIRTDYLPLNVIEQSCNCAGVFLIRETVSTTGKYYGTSGILAPELEILLVEGKRKTYQFSFPKGKKNKKECTLDAAKRELYEETGLRETDYEIYPDKYYIEYRTDTNQPHICYYMAKMINQDAELCPIDTKEIVSAKWFTPKEIYSMRNSFYLQRRQIVTRGIRDYLMRFVIRKSRKRNNISSIYNMTTTAQNNLGKIKFMFNHVPAVDNVTS
jgi:8-oxo-dGTP pyrophosphatase MutT (NUDIX family)